MKEAARWKGCEGFNLVEVTLALLVVAVGLISIFSLFPAGLDANAKAIGDTQLAIFAEEVFAGLRARAEKPGGWETLEEDWNRAPLPVSMETVWGDGALLATRPTPPDVVFTNVYYSAASYDPDEKDASVADHGFRYRLEIEQVEDKTGQDLPIKSARLVIWPGQFGRTNMENATVFYSEFYRWDG